MTKNILIFSDGTGQGGGVILDERRSNVYKLYRATRSAPDTCISPDQQIAFYDPGLGSSRGNEHIRFGVWRKVYNLLSKATGLGITRNIIDCYSFLIQHWEEGDRVYLYGFSRGAYTARCVGGVMARCGIPTGECGAPVKRDAKTARRIAKEAVVKVYQHGVGRGQARFSSQRDELSRKFREKYSSADVIDGYPQDQSNVVPYFIGVWDTVAALGAGKIKLAALGIILLGIIWSFYASIFVAIKSMGWVNPETPYLVSISTAVVATALFAFMAYYVTHMRLVTGLSDPWWQTFHLRAWKMKFYDTYLNPRVRYAKHALSIDENRADFARVAWTDRGETYSDRPQDWFEQIWFAGVHSDIGGSYPETESRLSDIALQWMVEKSKNAEHPILIDEHYLRIYPDATGVQHDEIKSSWFSWKCGLRTVPDDAPLHPSVIDRLKADAVVHYDIVKPYRPKPLKSHRGAQQFFKANSIPD